MPNLQDINAYSVKLMSWRTASISFNCCFRKMHNFKKEYILFIVKVFSFVKPCTYSVFVAIIDIHSYMPLSCKSCHFELLCESPCYLFCIPCFSPVSAARWRKSYVVDSGHKRAVFNISALSSMSQNVRPLKREHNWLIFYSKFKHMRVKNMHYDGHGKQCSNSK